MRLIEKIGENTYGALVENYLVYEKLCQLEDIEEKLGIELLTLVKALKDGIWTKGGYYSDILEEEPVFVSSPEIGMCGYYDECDKDYNQLVHDENVMCIYTYDYEIMIRQTRLKDYGKTWALTKEELNYGKSNTNEH